LPILSISSLVRRGLIALTSSGPKLHSTGPTSKLSRGTTSGPLLLRLGSRGRMGIGWWMTWSSLSWDSDPELDTDESERSIACDWPGRPLDWSCCSSAILVIVKRTGSLSGQGAFCRWRGQQIAVAVQILAVKLLRYHFKVATRRQRVLFVIS
jgi:hypothetical protein